MNHSICEYNATSLNKLRQTRYKEL